MKCPNCGSENVNLISNTTNRGFRGSDACCGYILLGPLGVLCGSFGSSKKTTNEFWVCNSCGSRFQDKQIKSFNKQLSQKENNFIEAEEEKQPEYVPVETIPAAVTEPPKEVKSYEPKTIVTRTATYSGNLSAEALLKRARIFLEDGEWEKAYEYSENALDVDAGYAEAYLAKFMAEYNISEEEDIPEKCADMMEDIKSLTELESFKKAHRFGDDEFKQRLTDYSDKAVYILAERVFEAADTLEKLYRAKALFDRISGYSDASQKSKECLKKHSETVYSHAKKLMDSASTENGFLAAKNEFESLGSYNDSRELAEECAEKAKYIGNKLMYEDAVLKQQSDTIYNLEAAILKFSKLSGYKDSDERLEKCRTRIEELEKIEEERQLEEDQRKHEAEKEKQELRDKYLKYAAIGCAAIFAVIIIVAIIFSIVTKIKDTDKSDTYNQAIELAESGDYDNAADILLQLGSYSDSSKLAEYYTACFKIEKGEYADAISAFENLGDFKDSSKLAKYYTACSKIESGEYADAISAFTDLGDFKDSAEMVEQLKKKRDEFLDNGYSLLEQGKYDEAIEQFTEYSRFDPFNDLNKSQATVYYEGIEYLDGKDYKNAIAQFAILGGLYSDSEAFTQYAKGLALIEDDSRDEAIATFEALGEFKDSAKLAADLKNKDKASIEPGVYVTTEEGSYSFDGGVLDFTEYTYYDLYIDPYNSDYLYDKTTQVEIDIKLNDYPQNNSKINNTLNQTWEKPSDTIEASPNTITQIKNNSFRGIEKQNQIKSVLLDNNLLFINVYSMEDAGSGMSMGVWSSEFTYVFDITTGKQLTTEELFNDFNSVKKLAVDYADKYIKNNIPYEDYSEIPYMDDLNNSQWYVDNNWEYDGQNFTVHFGWIIYTSYMYKTTDAVIPADEIRKYFAFGDKSAGSSASSKLSDIVGNADGITPDWTVDVSLADISYDQRSRLINDVEYCYEMFGFVTSSLTDFDADFYYPSEMVLSVYEYETEYYTVDKQLASTPDQMFARARECFTESFVSDDELTNEMFVSKSPIVDIPHFGSIDNKLVWLKSSPPAWSDVLYFDNAGVVSYTDTEAIVWVLGDYTIESSPYVRIFHMTRNNTGEMWKIDRIQNMWSPDSVYDEPFTYY